jgi:hypothetical protein
MSNTKDRRDFLLLLSGVGAGSALLGACTDVVGPTTLTQTGGLTSSSSSASSSSSSSSSSSTASSSSSASSTSSSRLSSSSSSSRATARVENYGIAPELL